MAVRLRPGQVAHRARLRAQRAALRRWPAAGHRLLPGPDPAAATGWPGGFVPLDARAALPWPDLAGLAAGQIELLGMVRELGDPAAWQHAEAPLLWRFHLHYWDWAWGLAADPDRAAASAVFARLWHSWRAAIQFGSGDAWLPYPAALRAWSWCGQYRHLVAGTDLDGLFIAALADHAGFLRWHLESDIGGNHLIKDLKALAGLAVFFGDQRLLRRVLGRLASQVSVQVLPDGGHYERAPAYHCQVLADLIDTAELVQAAGVSPGSELTGAIRRMRGWLDHVLLPDGQVPLLNDGYPVPAGLLAALRLKPPTAGRVPPGPPRARSLVVLPDTGLARAAIGGWHLLADVGPPCPDELPGHAHADTFGCLVHVDGEPLLIDTGTSTYAVGPRRQYERSTAAHSTVQIDVADSTEVWGAFRAGRRARVRDVVARATADTVTIEAAHDGFRRLPGRPVHRRRWTLTPSELTVDDEITGSGQHTICVRWHLAPGTGVQIQGRPADRPGAAGSDEARAAASTSGAAVIRTAGRAGVSIGVNVSATYPLRLSVESVPVAVGFSRTQVAPVLACRMIADLPVRVVTRWRRVTNLLAVGATQEVA